MEGKEMAKQQQSGGIPWVFVIGLLFFLAMVWLAFESGTF
jgi:hypothetical protein